ncbi:Carnosic acid synthase-like protein [Drosera capensis]
MVEESRIHELPYLNAVVKETLRLHPILPLLVPHSPSLSTKVGGYTIPKGSRLFFNAWTIHRDPSIWENPSSFNPDRFLNDGCDFIGQSDFTYIPFGSGRRSCAGTIMAEKMILLPLASLLHSFNWKSPKGENLEISDKFGLVLRMKTSLVLIPSPRLSNPALYQ